MFKCEICGYETATIHGLVSHISCYHKIKIQDYYIKYIDENIPKCICGKNLPFKNIKVGYHKFCCSHCANKFNTSKRWENDAESFNIEERTKTTIKLYGGCGFASKQTAKKIKETKKEKYGNEYYCNKDQIDITNKERYGDSNIFKTKHFKDKAKDTKKEKYGDENYNNIEQQINTMIDRYGYTNYNNFEHIKKIKKERYGDENYNNREKARKTCKEKYGREIPFNTKLKYKGIYFDSKWEIYYYEYLKKYNIPFIYHPESIKYFWAGDNKIHEYQPDFLIYNTYIEIKNDYLYEKMLIEGSLENAKLNKMNELHTIILRKNNLKEIINEMKGEIKI